MYKSSLFFKTFRVMISVNINPYPANVENMVS